MLVRRSNFGVALTSLVLALAGGQNTGGVETSLKKGLRSWRQHFHSIWSLP